MPSDRLLPLLTARGNLASGRSTENIFSSQSGEIYTCARRGFAFPPSLAAPFASLPDYQFPECITPCYHVQRSVGLNRFAGSRSIKSQAYSHRVSREVQSAITRLNTGHAFTGAYRPKFKNLPPATEDDFACICGAVPEDTEHVHLHCPLTHDQRLRHLSIDGMPDSLS
jgi:hypothetical protein